MKIALCEDERFWVEEIKKSISLWSNLRSVPVQLYSFTDPNKLIKSIIDSDYDLLILDISLGKDITDGINTAGILRKVGVGIPIIFVTVDAFRADEGYIVEAMGYVKKPVDDKKLHLFLDRVLKKMEPEKLIEINTGSKIIKLRQADIVYLEVLGHTVKCHTNSDIHTFRGSLSKAMFQLGSEGFVQVHKSYLVQINKIYSVKTTYPYEITLLKNDSTETIPVGRKYINKVLEVYSDDVMKKVL